MVNSYRNQRIRLASTDPRCHWCKKETREYALKPMEIPPDDMATIDHTVSRYFRNRGTKVKKVLACHKCNHDRAHKENLKYKHMFICKECLESNYKNQYFAPVPSRGPCEICKIVKDCQDISSGRLVKKDIINPDGTHE